MFHNLNHMKLGVIVGRFQAPNLTAAHRHLIDVVVANSDVLLICVGQSPVRNTRNEPLSFDMRKIMIYEYCRNCGIEPLKQPTIIPIPDLGDMKLWCQQLDEIIDIFIAEQVQSIKTITIYGGRDSVTSYYHGKYQTETIQEKPNLSATQVREAVLTQKDLVMSEDFRFGMIYASQWRFPCGFPTADAACLRRKDDGVLEILLCRKPNRTPFQLPGGFFDPTIDKSLENTALRELCEETGVFGEIIQYVGSYVVNDFRYRKEIDKIITTVYEVMWIEGEPSPKDDIAEVQWFDLDYVVTNLDELIYPAHYQIVIDIINNHRS